MRLFPMNLSSQSLTAILITGVAGVTAGTLWLVDGGAPRSAEDTPPRSAVPDIATFASAAESNCPAGDEACMEKNILAITDDYGPVEAIGTLTEMIGKGVLKGRSDYHDFVHRIGRKTAKKFGLNPEGFFLCPVDYNYGCQHGFFEQALVEEPDATKAAEKVCDPSLMKDKPLKFLFYCYHGVGHGIMMAKAYDLRTSLDVCEEFTGEAQRSGCYQGVFMENVVGFQNGTARTGSFSETDKLAPCNALEKQYRLQCYLNHGGYLAGIAGSGVGAVERATQPCLEADPADISPCIQSVALNATNPGWQAALAPEPSGDLIKDAVAICSLFPTAYITDCIVAGVDNLANFDRSNTVNMAAFCAAVGDPYKERCYREIGAAVKNELPAGATAETVCDPMPEEYRAACRTGFGL